MRRKLLYLALCMAMLLPGGQAWAGEYCPRALVMMQTPTCCQTAAGQHAIQVQCGCCPIDMPCRMKDAPVPRAEAMHINGLVHLSPPLVVWSGEPQAPCPNLERVGYTPDSRARSPVPIFLRLASLII